MGFVKIFDIWVPMDLHVFSAIYVVYDIRLSAQAIIALSTCFSSQRPEKIFFNKI